ncbi:hypothetical protein [Lactobacillus taiwanensis]|uniref:Uncharacterized protein n=1 Tax=Lactobacillus taiwanensis TaxID=508451 RepID=A0A256LBC4_9LACO|nr:hypothetical protein [Lactobacillus taiwanensis]OYR86682.1 hypothetical protein CBF53_11665 [Lactobacillus taiwanensis]OYR90463.1 hypothetical protein CBF70_09395 [Lactobacillus taiwanensis]OYR95266.1 hypothetical protein CBF58_06960 [Lactobacillus taiwanensis]OYR95547.1 hypothetical protein CBF51_07350 [Lactobacillus taiwanensis]OYR99913.1 hypothetical protein CBF61_07805 [Lactobacillus taiwanensis]
MKKFSINRLIKLGLSFSTVWFVYFLFFSFKSLNDFSTLRTLPTPRVISLFVILIVISLFLGFILAGVWLSIDQPKFKFKWEYLYKGILVGIVWATFDMFLINSGRFMIIPVIIDLIIGTLIGMLLFSRRASKK